MMRELTNDMVVCLTIHRLSGGRGSVTFDELVDHLSDYMSEDEVSIHIDDLYDLGIVDGRWEVRDGFFTRTFLVSREAAGFVESAYLRSTLR